MRRDTARPIRFARAVGTGNLGFQLALIVEFFVDHVIGFLGQIQGWIAEEEILVRIHRMLIRRQREVAP